jgi:hypothetical protein
MNKQLKNKWVSALRSGSYTQGQHSLRNTRHGEVKHCCLGVLLCASGTRYAPQMAKSDSVRDYEIVEEMIGGSDVRYDLAEMNDEGKSFDEIANYIEREL